MFTSNFARIRRLPAELRPVAISRGIPGWYNGIRLIGLAPTWAIMKWPRERFDPAYDAILAGFDPAELDEQLGDNAVLLCWEPPNIWCHRRRVAEWLEESLGIVVPEFGFERSKILPYKDMPSKSEAKRLDLAGRKRYRKGRDDGQDI